MPDGVFAVATGARRHGRGARRRGRHDHVHRLDGHRQEGHGQGGRDAHAGVAGARRQGPDGRPGRRRRRARGQRRRLLLDAQRRPDVRQRRARLRRGAGLRRVRGQGHREGARAAQRPLDRPRGRPTSARSPSRPRSRSSSATCSDARRQGRARASSAASAATTGQGGYWFEPTVLVDVDHTMECMREETFGPTLPIMKVADAEEAIRLANDSPYGLGGLGVLQGRRARRGGRAPHRGRRRVRQRRARQLLRARAADGRREGQRHGLAPRRRRHPQVHPAAGAARSRACTPSATCTCTRTARR